MVAVSNYVDGIILATHDTARTQQIQKNISNNSECCSLLEKSSCQPLIEVLDSWKTGDEKQILKKL